MNFIQIMDESTFALSIWLGSVIEKSLTGMGIPLSWVNYAKLFVYILIAALIVGGLYYVVKAIATFLIRKTYTTTGKSLLKYVLDNKVPRYLALLLPYIFIRSFIPTMLSDFPEMIKSATKVADIYLVLTVIWTIMAVIKSLVNLLQERPAFAQKPIRSYIQVMSIIFYSVGGIIMFAIITNQSLGVIVAGLGAASAVTMLVFQDSIKGFVGSIQMTTNNMVELNDWITVGKYNADGSVEEINLTTVKIRNFDNTITTVPTYSLISDSFQNWKPMQNSGGRRLKKSFFMRQSSIRFMNGAELKKFEELPALKKMIQERVGGGEQDAFIGDKLPLTNNDLYMAYAQDYLNKHPELRNDMTCMFRIGVPTTEGLPLEVYAFTNTVVWTEYERISTEVINHLVAITNYFDLKLCEMPTFDTMKAN